MVLWAEVVAQMPQGISYQALARNAEGQIMADKEVSLRMTILGDRGQRVYVENHRAQTNTLGLFRLIIGTGTSVFGSFYEINWSTGSFALRVEMALENEVGYQFMGESTLYSVPFAFHARSAEQVDDADADPRNEIQSLRRQGDSLYLSHSSAIYMPDHHADLDQLRRVLRNYSDRVTELYQLTANNRYGLIDSVSTMRRTMHDMDTLAENNRNRHDTMFDTLVALRQRIHSLYQSVSTLEDLVVQRTTEAQHMLGSLSIAGALSTQDALYFQNPNPTPNQVPIQASADQEGNWRLRAYGDELRVERREAGVWVIKFRVQSGN